MRTVLATLLLTSIPLLAACEEEPAEKCEPVLTVVATPPLISSGDMMMAQVDARDFTLVAPDEDPEEEFDENCVGHYRVYLGSTDSSPILESDIEETTFAVEGDPGDYDLIFRLHGPDGVPIIPEVRDTIEITIQ